MSLQEFISMYGEALNGNDMSIIANYIIMNSRQPDLMDMTNEVISTTLKEISHETADMKEALELSCTTFFPDFASDTVTFSECIRAIKIAYQAYKTKPQEFHSVMEKILENPTMSLEVLNTLNPQAYNLYMQSNIKVDED